MVLSNTNIDFFMPVKIISGESCILANKSLFGIGKKALIITGANSAVKSGALADVTSALDSLGIGFSVFNKIMENPLVSICYEGGAAAFETGADFIIGIGGGSAMDASKAIASYVANPDLPPEGLFESELRPSLPMILIPTTAGTGSEANMISVLTLDGKDAKKSFKSDYSYAKFSFVDPVYTYSLSYDYTVSTALDAFCHCFESYLSPKSSEITRTLAVDGARDIWKVLSEISPENPISKENRRLLAYASCRGGIAINGTGTGFPHPLGYNLTMYRGIPHGKACAAFTGEYIKHNMQSSEGKRLITDFSERIGTSSELIAENVPKWADISLNISSDEIDLFIRQVGSASNFKNSPYVINETEMREIYSRLFN
jgi:alcohol dehydrogenase class IV